MRITSRSGSLQPVFVVLLLLLIAGIGVGIWMFLGSSQRPDMDQGRQVADAFLSKIREGEIGPAWESTSVEFKSAQGRESFQQYVKSHPALVKPLNFASLQTVQIGERTRSEYVYELPEGQATGRVHILIGDDQGHWKVARLTVE